MIFVNSKIKEKNGKVLPEILLHNRLEKDIQKMMYPVHLALTIFLSSKFNVKNDYITPKSIKFYIFTFFCVLGVYGLGIKRLFFGEYEDTMGTYNYDVMAVSFAIYFVFYCVGFTIIFVLNIVHSEISISLVLVIQNIYRSLDFSACLDRITVFNWISIIVTIGINIFVHFLYYGLYNEFFICDIILDIMFITFDVNLTYGILVIMMLRIFLEKWIELVHNAKSVEDGFDYIFFIGVYRNVLKAYTLYKNIFKLLILFHTFDTFFRSLSYFSIILQVMTMSAGHNEEEELQTSLAIFMVAVWLGKDILLVIIQSVQSEKFYVTVEEAESACIQRLKNTEYSEKEEMLCKNVIQANRASFRKMSACGLFDIDASLPPKLMGLITNYIVVMLQSAFL